LLPIAQDPDSRQRRREVFDSWNTGGRKKGTSASLSLQQLEKGVQDLFKSEIGEDIEEVRTAVNYAWKAARKVAPSTKKGGAKRVDFKEFHAFIMAFRYYLELAELFDHLDALHEEDQKLSLRDCKQGLEKLEVWGVSSAMLDEEFKDVEFWTPKWKFPDFAKFCVGKRWSQMELELELDSDDEEVLVEEGKASLQDAADIADLRDRRRREGEELKEDRKQVLDMFAQWDSHQSGKISEAELARVIQTLNPDITAEACKTMFEEADVNNDGSIDYEEFCLWLFAQDEL
jgi:calmodulin